MSSNSKCTANSRCLEVQAKILWLWLTSFYRVCKGQEEQVQILCKTWCNKCFLECLLCPELLLKHNLRLKRELPHNLHQLKLKEQRQQLQPHKGHRQQPEDNQLKSELHKQRPLNQLLRLQQQVKHHSLLLPLVEHSQQLEQEARNLAWSNCLTRLFTSSALFAIVCKEITLSSRGLPCLNCPSIGTLWSSWDLILQTWHSHSKDSCRICSDAVILCNVKASSQTKLIEDKLQKWPS